MHGIKEVDIGKSTDELVTSRSIVERTDLRVYDMLDAMIVSALKKLFDKHVSSALRNTTDSFEGDRLLT